MNGMDYNTQLPEVRLSEYGRHVQLMTEHLQTIEDKEKRTELAKTIIKVMINLNPSIRDLDDYEHKLWDHLHIISGFKLDVNSPFPPPSSEILQEKPGKVPYKESLIKFRFYGRNLQNMVERAAEMEEGETKSAFVNYIASFMVNSSRNWNDENLSAETVTEHLSILSKDELKVDAEGLDLFIDKRQKNRNFQPNNNGGKFQNNNNFRKKKNRNKRR